MYSIYVKNISDLIVFILIYANLISCDSNSVDSNSDIKIIKVDTFPHNIDQDFTINLHHPEIEYHHLYAVIILEVTGTLLKESQQIFIYPGYLSELEHRIKETYFHTMNYENNRFNTKIVVRFFRDSQAGEFAIHYSAIGARDIHLPMPRDSKLVYKETIHLYRPPILNLIIKSHDDHTGGLSLNKEGFITCTSSDGFPSSLIDIKFQREIDLIKNYEPNEFVVNLNFMTKLNYHLNNVTCSSGGVSVTKTMKVFHHAESVEISPDNLSYMSQGSHIECKSVGGGYPAPVVEWTVGRLNETSKNYFTINSKKSLSRLKINSIAPNNTQWQFNCSSLNIIPHMDHSGPNKLINITIGVNREAARLAIVRIWTITVVVVVVLIIFLIGALCIGSRLRCNSRSRSHDTVPDNDVPLMASSPDILKENVPERDDIFKDQEFVV